jgi:hypothetical protein
MTTLDLKAGYWQVSLKQADRDKTAFVSPFGTYPLKRMPFGLKNAPRWAPVYQNIVIH